MIYAILITLILGLALMIRGLRGRRIDDHPLCRGCGFDLTGKPADSTRCPECGADLNLRRSRKNGHRRIGLFCVSTGGAMCFIAVLAAGVLAWGEAHRVDWLHYAPLSYVLTQAEISDPIGRGRALKELMVRTSSASMPAQDWDQIADAGLDYQGDISKPWDSRWGDWLESARQQHHLTDDRWIRYASQSWLDSCHVTIRPQVSRGDPIPYRIDWSAARVAQNSVLDYTQSEFEARWPNRPAATKPVDEDFDERYYPGLAESFRLSMSGRDGSYQESQISADEIPSDLHEGLQHCTFHSSIYITPTAHDRKPRIPNGILLPSTRPHDIAESPPLAAGEIALPASFTLLSADRPSVRLIHGFDRAERIRRSIQITIRSGRIDLRAENCPIGIGFDVYLRSHFGEIKAATFAGTSTQKKPYVFGVGAWSPDSEMTLAGNKGRSELKSVDVIFRPSVAAAAATIDTFEIWDGKLEFNNVPVGQW